MWIGIGINFAWYCLDHILDHLPRCCISAFSTSLGKNSNYSITWIVMTSRKRSALTRFSGTLLSGVLFLSTLPNISSSMVPNSRHWSQNANKDWTSLIDSGCIPLKQTQYLGDPENGPLRVFLVCRSLSHVIYTFSRWICYSPRKKNWACGAITSWLHVQQFPKSWNFRI